MSASAGTGKIVNEGELTARITSTSVNAVDNKGVLNALDGSRLAAVDNAEGATLSTAGAVAAAKITSQGKVAVAENSQLKGISGGTLELTSSGAGEIVNEGALEARIANTGKAIDNKGELKALAGSSLGSVSNAAGAALSTAGAVVAVAIESQGKIAVAAGSQLSGAYGSALEITSSGQGEIANSGHLTARIASTGKAIDNTGMLDVLDGSSLGAIDNAKAATLETAGAVAAGFITVKDKATLYVTAGSTLAGAGSAALEIAVSGEGDILNKGSLTARIANAGDPVENKGELKALAGSSLGDVDNALGATLRTAGLVAAGSIANAGGVFIAEGSELDAGSFAGGSGKLSNEGVLRARDGFALGDVSNAASGLITTEGAVAAKSV
ncbi:MAG: hypothetical protein HUK26_08100, partial [Duodenibacillus sp.]|nr:hypothetical protein [Duodenibacillus sp.]